MRSAIRIVAGLAWLVWHLPAICRRCAEEERDIRLHAADAGMTPDEWLRANRDAGL